MTEPALAWRNVSFKYGRDSPAPVTLADVELELGPGELLAIVGPNGAGKSTLLRLGAGLLQPAGGQVTVGGRPIHRWPRWRLARELAFVPQIGEPVFDFEVEEVVALGRYPHVGRRSLGPGDRDVVRETLRLTGLLELRRRSLSQLSGGERQRVQIARALAQQARILLLDEPVAHLDLGHQAEIFTLLRRLVAAGRIAVAVVLHDLHLAAEYGDRVALLERGRLVAVGRPREVLTSELLSQVYRVSVRVRARPDGGLSIHAERRSANESGGPRVHLIAGGGSGDALMDGLLAAGYQVSAGVLNEGDTDWVHATARGIPCLAAPAFAAVDDWLAQLEDWSGQSSALVVASVPIGPGNLGNLRAALSVRRRGLPVLLVGEGPDFTGGEATRLRRQLVLSGALEVGEEEFLPKLAEVVRRTATT